MRHVLLAMMVVAVFVLGALCGVLVTVRAECPKPAYAASTWDSLGGHIVYTAH